MSQSSAEQELPGLPAAEGSAGREGVSGSRMPGQRVSGRRGRVTWHGRIPVWVWFSLPGLVLYLMFFIGPMVAAFRLSLYNWSGIGTQMSFVGWQNFRDALTDAAVYSALLHNLYFFGLIFVLQNTVGLGLALLLNERLRGHQIHRTLLYVPSILSLVVTGFIWDLMLNPQIGLVNPLLTHIGLKGWQPIWLGDPSISLTVVILVQAWNWMGVPMVIYLAGLQSIPHELIEAARIDGAGRWAVLVRVVFPLLAAPFTTLTIFCFIVMFKVFDIVYVLEGALGSPDASTTTIGTMIYQYAFGGLGGGVSVMPRMSYAMSIGVLSFFLLGAVAGIGLLLLRRREVALG
jgi:raffinose/stachyose/melibiose transport system permease protein